MNEEFCPNYEEEATCDCEIIDDSYCTDCIDHYMDTDEIYKDAAADHKLHCLREES